MHQDEKREPPFPAEILSGRRVIAWSYRVFTARQLPSAQDSGTATIRGSFRSV